MRVELAPRFAPATPFPQVRFPPLRIRLSTLFVLALFFLTVGPFQSFLFNEETGTGGGILLLQVAWGCLYATALAWAFLDGKLMIRLIFRSKFFLLAPLLALASSQWAQDSTPTIRRSIGLLFTYLLGAFIAVHCDRRLQLKLLCIVLLASAVLSYLVELFLPGWVPVVEAHPGSWNGVFPHKNVLAKSMALLVVALLCTVPRNSLGRWAKWTGLLAAGGLLVRSQAASAVLVMAALLACFFVLRQMHRGTRTVILVVVALLVVTVGSFFIDTIQSSVLQLFGKTSDLSGRTSIWAASWLSIAKHPLLGYGFHGFWRENNESLTARALIPNHWDAPHAHNGYIETLLELGIVGLVIIVTGFIILAGRAFRRYRASADLLELWPIMLALLFCFYNMSESMDMVENTVGWILFTSAVFTDAVEQETVLVPALAL
jgi:exopolysaccharide production protein ExoQ